MRDSLGHEMMGKHDRETPDVSRIGNPDVQHEVNDVNASAIIKFIGGLAGALLFSFALVFGLFYLLNWRAVRADAEEARARLPLARRENDRLPPEPRLQLAPGSGITLKDGRRVDLTTDKVPEQPQAEMRVLRKEWDHDLNNYYWVDRNAGTVGLPIEEAMRRVAESNLPVRQQQQQQEGQQQNRQQADGFDQLPTYQSAGRRDERRKQ